MSAHSISIRLRGSGPAVEAAYAAISAALVSAEPLGRADRTGRRGGFVDGYFTAVVLAGDDGQEPGEVITVEAEIVPDPPAPRRAVSRHAGGRRAIEGGR